MTFMKTTEQIPAGMALIDKSPLGSGASDWRLEPSPHTPESDPNHPIYKNKLFGYDVKEFMAKQYRKGV